MGEGILYLVTSFWLGAVHAATPGHGKTIAASYIVGVRGRPVDALVLGIFVTLSHTSGIVLVAVLAHQARRDQSSARRSRRLFRGPQRSRDGNNHPPLRRPTRADLIARAPATARCVGAAPRSGVAGMSMWSMSSDARASRIALIMVDGAAIHPAWPAPLTPRG